MTPWRSRSICWSAAIVALLLARTVTFGQQDERARRLDAQVARIFGTKDYDPPRFGPARWLPDGVSYSTVEPGSGGTSDIVRYEAATGARQVLVAGSRLVPAGQTAALTISDYAWSDDGGRLLIFTNTKKVWRQNTRGDYWVLGLADGSLKKLGAGSPESSLMFAKFSPDGSRVAYVRSNNLYVEDIADGRVTPITSDGSDTVINGTSDWVYEEELDLRDGFRWAPDGKAIAYWRFDTSGVGSFSLVNDTDTLYPAVTRIPYPKAGTTNSAVRIGVTPASGGSTTWMKTPGDPRETYLATLDWVDARTVCIQQLNRLQNRNDYLVGDMGTGDVNSLVRDESSTWVEIEGDTRWVDRQRAFLLVSERDGWRHVYRVPRGGGAPRLLTRFEADVIEVEGLDEAGGWLYVSASPDNATQKYLYRSRLDGTGVPERVTPRDQPGSHSYTIAPGGHLAFHTYSRADRPPRTDVVGLPAHDSRRSLTDTTALEERLRAVVTPPVEFFGLDVGGGVTLDGWMLKPSHFDPARRYPMVVFVYGEPAGQTVVDGWGGNDMLFNRALADAGYVVVSVDNRGTPAPKGAAWRKVVYGAVGELSASEQASAVRALVARHPFLDPARVGVWGWSGGGSNTLNAMFRYPDVFQVGVSVAPVPDQTLYDTIYQERYMGLPQDNVDGYKRGSPINFAEGLKGHLLVVHGTGDDNVHYQGTERLINRLVALGKPFDMMAYPNRTHSISEGPGTPVHVHQLIARYFLEHLDPEARSR